MMRSALPLLPLILAGLAACRTSTPAPAAPSPRPAAPQPAAAAPARAPEPPDVAAIPSPEIDTVQPGRFDTGKMWTFENPPLDYFQQEYGFRPGEQWLRQVRLSALRLPNCSASFVSASGLVMSNHHCAREAATAVSREGEDLLENGFYATRLEDERRVPELHVDQLVEIRDVTQEIATATLGVRSEEAQAEARDRKIEEIEGRVSRQTGLTCEATSLYHGGRHSLYCYRRYEDVRLVFVPEGQIGYFGGDPDNFTYPRYALDVSFFRVYDQSGAPVRPEAHLAWSTDGAEPGELVFVVGNPGSTSRLETVAQLEYKRDIQYPFTLRMLESRAEILSDVMARNPARKQELINDYFSLTNSLKAIGGELKGLRTPDLMARKRAFERNFQKAVRARPGLAERYGTLWSEIARLRSQIAELSPVLNGLNQGGLLRSRTLETALNLLQYAGASASGQVPDSQLTELRQEILATEIDPDLDARILAAQLEDARILLGPDDPWLTQALAGRAPDQAARAIISESAVTDSARRAAMLEQPRQIPAGGDPAVQLMMSALPRLQQAYQQFQRLTTQEEARTSRLARALFEVYGDSIAPDATFTLRLADGVVKGYEYNGTEAPWHTTFYGLYDRHYSFAGRDDWALPKRWETPPAGFDLKTPLNMVSTNDIIGGNSGSPLIDREARIVGLIFDGNIESLPGDFIYTTESARSVSVHSEGIIEALRDLYRAQRIVQELRPARP